MLLDRVARPSCIFQIIDQTKAGPSAFRMHDRSMTSLKNIPKRPDLILRDTIEAHIQRLTIASFWFYPTTTTTLLIAIDPHAHRPIAIRPPHTAFLAAKLLLLPHLDALLTLLQGLLAGSPRRLPMRARHGDEDAFLADGDDAQAVDHGDGCERVLGGDGGADFKHGLERFGLVRRVFELFDGLAAEVVACRACGLIG